ncbi:TPA: hypothetical protein OLZ61_004121 [Clostridioides difficile]|nr:hypothetical protein [Clostridioides difficile]HCQ5778356.1 hypothetical protein [Clostridioides difficile]HCQ5958635.1 hypothetical protein [Clostridioides difficile]
MEECKVCGKSYKKVTASHLKTHDITLEEYLKLYKKEEYKERKIVQFLMENYVSQSDKFKFLYYSAGKDAQCSTITVTQGSKRKFPLGEGDIRKHLRGLSSIGIYPLCKTETRLIAFDIDINTKADDKYKSIDNCLEVLELLVNKLYQFGITDKYVLMSFSGSKGYHVDIILDEFISKEVVEKFQKLVSAEVFSDASFEANKGVIIEFRGSNDSGYKLPLCYHYKTNNKAYLCNEYGVEIDDLECLNKKNFAASEIQEVVDINYEYLEDISILEQFNETMKTTSLLDMHIRENKARREKVNELFNTHITKEYINNNVKAGSRHFLLYEVALYLRFVSKLNEEQALLMLQSWVSNWWDKSLVDRECESLIKTNIRWVYRRGKYFDNANKELIITREHMKEVISIDLKHKQKNSALRRLYYILMIHSYYFADSKTGEFQMSYSTMEKMGAIKNNRSVLKKQLEELEALGKIVIVSSSVKKAEYEKDKVYESNVYKLNKSFTTSDSKGLKHCNNEYDCNNCMQIFSCTLLDRRYTTSFITAKEYKNLKDSCPYNKNKE